MSTTLNLADHLLARARYRQHLGRHRDALRLLTSLTRLRDLPAAVAEEVQFRLGQICLRLGKPRRARRHFAAALHHRPDSPRYHFFLGRALDADRDGDPGRAAEHYRTSLDLDGTQADVLYHFGSLALRLGRADEALPCLRAAAAQAPDDPRLLAKVATALRTARG